MASVDNSTAITIDSSEASKPEDKAVNVTEVGVELAGADNAEALPEASDIEPTCFENVGVLVITLGLGYFVLWCLFGDAMLPNNSGWLFSLLLVYGCGTVGGMIVEKIQIGSTKLPPLVGMLMMGFIIRNVFPFVNESLDKTISSRLRGLALAVILIRAGLGLSLDDLRALAGTMTMMSTIPAMVEATSGMAFSMLFFGFDIKWGFMLGFILADVSPAVTVPLLLKFQVEGLGADKGIPSILLAASSLNSVFAICCFGVVQGFNFTGSGVPMWETILRGVLDVIGGVVIGVISGWLVCRLTKHMNSSAKFMFTFVFACMQIFGLKVEPLRSSGGNALATLVMGITIAKLWDKAEFEGMQASFNFLWKTVGERMMFSLLGASMAIADLQGDVVGAGLVIIFVGLFFRGLAAMASISFTDWNTKEKIFTAITWCPKATVQAALSTVALEYVQSHADEFGGTGTDTYTQSVEYSTKLKTVAILSIIATAPLFAALMDWAGYNLLQPPKEAPLPEPMATPVMQSIEKVAVDDLHGSSTGARVRLPSAPTEGVVPSGTDTQAGSMRSRMFSVPVKGRERLPSGVTVVRQGNHYTKQFA